MSISAKERREIPDSKMGVPGKDKYPLRTPREIKSANNLINNGDITPEEKKALARKIRHRAEEEGMDTSKLHAANKVAGVAEQVPPMSDGTSLGNAPPRMMAPYYDEQDELFSQLDKMDSRRHVLTLEDAKRIVAEIHAQVEKDSKPPTGNQNCQLCTWCAEAQCRGIKVLPRPIYSPRDPALEIVGETIVLHPVRQKIASQRDVIEAVRGNVDSRWYVHVNWAGSEGGHEFLVVNINDYAYIMDPQAGILEEIDETDSPKVKYFMHANYANSYIVRLDNRSFNSTLLNLVNNPNRVLPWDPKLDIPYMKDHGLLSDEDYQAAMDMGDLPVKESFMDEYATPTKYVMIKAKESDLDLVYQSELETVGENKDDPKVQRYIKQDAKDSLGHTKIIVVDGKDVGVYQAYETNYYGLREGKRDWWYLAHIYIKPEYRNLGIGSDIIKKDITTHDKILLQVMKSNKRAQKLYESLGFIVDMENDHGGLVMRFDKSKPVQEGHNGKMKTMAVRILYKKWSVANKQQYDPIARFWDIVEQYVPCTKLYGFGYGWNNDEFIYGIIFRSGLTQEVIDAVKKEFPDIRYNDTFLVPVKSSYDSTYTGKSEQIRTIYDKIWSNGPLSCELEEFKPNGECKIHVIYKLKHVQEGAIQDIKNGVHPFSDKMVFHVSHEKHNDGQVWKPRVPDYLDPYNPEETGFEDNTTPRVCFSTSIEGALNGITVNLPRQNPDQFDKMYVYIPEKPWKEYKHKTTKELVNEKLVYDANVTREVWIMEPVRLKLYGVIKVDQVSNVKRKAVVPTSKGQKDDRNYFTYKWHWVVKPKVLEKGTKFDYSPERVIADLCIDMKKFKYGLIKDGRLQTGNVSETDYQKYWVFHSSQEVDEAGGGNCWDMVEYEAGYLEAFGVPYKKYFINFTKTDGKTIINTHTICVVPLNGKFIYLEQAYKRVVDEWGYERQKTFDSLKEIFQYVAEVSAEHDNQDLNYGVWDYTDAKIDYGTPADDFCKWIMSKCRMIYDGEAKKPTVKKEGYRVSRFGNIFQEEDEKLSETENITIGDLDLGGDDDSDDEGPGLPGYIEDRMSDDDLKAYNSNDDDFKIPEEGDFESFKVSDEKLEEARGPIEPQPDENLNAANVELGQFGKDTSDVQNEYDPKEVTILMKLMASEADAMNEYMDGAKETNVDVLRRLYADIANEERFHMEQLLYAKCELTGEKYVPKDPEVKSEYEELLKMGMDEETAMATAVDRCHIRGTVTIEDDIDDVDEISKDMETMESALMMFNALFDSTQMVLESGNATKDDVDKAYNTFVEACMIQEAVYDATPASSEKSALSKANKRGPIQLLRDTLRFLIRAVMTLIRKFVEFTKRLSNRSKEIRRFIKQYGLAAIFSDKASFYFINLKHPESAYVDTHLDTLLGLAIDTLHACAFNLNCRASIRVNAPRDPKLNINTNMVRGAELLQGVQLVKSAFVIPKDEEEQERIAAALFGWSDFYGDDGKTVNTLNTLRLKCDAWSRFMQDSEDILNQIDKLQQDTNSIYYTNRKKYDQAEKCLEVVVKTCKAWVSAIQSDINTIIKIDQRAMLAAKDNIASVESREKQSRDQNPDQQRRHDTYENNYRTPEASGQKVSKFSRFGR